MTLPVLAACVLHHMRRYAASHTSDGTTSPSRTGSYQSEPAPGSNKANASGTE
jgi:hypothetical protein